MRNISSNRIIWAAGALFTLILAYLLCEILLYFLHQQSTWHAFLIFFGTVVIIISAVFNCHKVMIGTVVGYLIGFVLAMLFQTDIVIGPDDLMGSNAWIIWTVSYLIIILASIVWEIVTRIMKRKIIKA